MVALKTTKSLPLRRWQQIAESATSSIVSSRAEVRLDKNRLDKNRYDYRAPARFGDELEVRLSVADIGRTSFGLAYEIVNVATDRKLADGKTVMVCYDYAAAKPQPLPDATRALPQTLKPA